MQPDCIVGAMEMTSECAPQVLGGQTRVSRRYCAQTEIARFTVDLDVKRERNGRLIVQTSQHAETIPV